MVLQQVMCLIISWTDIGRSYNLVVIVRLFVSCFQSYSYSNCSIVIYCIFIRSIIWKGLERMCQSVAEQGE